MNNINTNLECHRVNQDSVIGIPAVHPSNSIQKIPIEVILNVGDYLERSHKRDCLRISSLWYKAFLPEIWSFVRLGHVDFVTKNDTNQKPLRSLAGKHASLIKTLEVSFAAELDHFSENENEDEMVLFEDLNTVTFPNLTSLVVLMDSEENEKSGDLEESLEAVRVRNTSHSAKIDKQVSSLVQLIQKYQSTLEELSLDSFYFHHKTLLTALAGCPRLRLLRYRDFSCTKPMDWFAQCESLWYSAQLKSLELRGAWFGSEPMDFSLLRTALKEVFEGRQTQLQDISYVMLQSQGEAALEIPASLVLNSPNLVRLRWWMDLHQYPNKTDFPMQLLAKAAREGVMNFPKLESFSMTGGEYESDDLRAVLGALTTVTKLDLYYTNFDTACYRILAEEFPRYRDMLTELNLKVCCNVSSEVVQNILCSFPSLKVFETDELKPTEELMTDERPWVCRGLKRLTLYFIREMPPAPANQELSEGEDDGAAETSTVTPIVNWPQSVIHSFILERLATLTKLESYQYGRTTEYIDGTLNLSLGEEGGLDLLKSLSRLRKITGPLPIKHRPRWGLEEVEWVLKHWRGLETVTRFNIEPEAQELLKERGVTCLDS
ncbi:hypothetical protein BGZ83_007700 [Gryganskiella cystojenkinii]|nr:hypothetical protein BGZ83_007700 [Gryganskiella cystojenkinii]